MGDGFIRATLATYTVRGQYGRRVVHWCEHFQRWVDACTCHGATSVSWYEFAPVFLAALMIHTRAQAATPARKRRLV